jgi:hypothetical protein
MGVWTSMFTSLILFAALSEVWEWYWRVLKVVLQGKSSARRLASFCTRALEISPGAL